MKRLVALGALCLTLVTTPPPSSRAAGPIRMGYIGGASDAGIYIALDRGYFREQGIEVSLERFNGGAAQMVLLGSGRLEIATGSPSAAFFNAIIRGLPVAVVADKGSIRKGFSYSPLVVRKALVDSGRFQGLRDLRGMILAENSHASVGHYLYSLILKAAGLTMRDVAIEYVNLPDQPAAMAHRKIDAAVMLEPFATVVVRQGIGKIVVPLDQLFPGFQIAVVFYNSDWARRHPDDARRWMIAYVKGLRTYNEALKTPQGRDDVIRMLMAYTGIKDRSVLSDMQWPGLDPDGVFTTRSLLDYERWLMNEHQITQFVLPDQLADLSYVRHAIAVLGPHRP